MGWFVGFIVGVIVGFLLGLAYCRSRRPDDDASSGPAGLGDQGRPEGWQDVASDDGVENPRQPPGGLLPGGQ